MEQTVRRYSISPGAIASSSLPKRGKALWSFENDNNSPDWSTSSPFAMSATEWLEIQLYVEKGLSLPDTAYKLAHRLNMPSSTNLSAYADLITIYHEINIHVTEWKNNIFPESVSMANDVYKYSLKVREYYEQILYLADFLSRVPRDKAAKHLLVKHLRELSQTVRVYQARGRSVAENIKKFADQTLMDNINLNGADGKSGLMGAYRNRYRDAAERVDLIKKNLANDYQLINELNREYNYYVVEKAKIPYYRWIWPFGTIAAAILENKYNSKIKDALNRINQAEIQINNLSRDSSSLTQMIYVLDHVLTETSSISAPLSRGLNIIQTIEGSWKAIADDLDALADLIANNLVEALPYIRNLRIEAAVREWEAVGESADRYRQYAYIQIN